MKYKSILPTSALVIAVLLLSGCLGEDSGTIASADTAANPEEDAGTLPSAKIAASDLYDGNGNLCTATPFSICRAAKWQKADLHGIDLTGADLSNGPAVIDDDPVLIGCSISPITAASYLHEINLSGANLSGANMTGAIFGKADLSNAKLTEAVLRCADGPAINLSGATAVGASFNKVRFIGANLADANLTGAHMEGARLDGANLSRTNLTGTDLRTTVFRPFGLQLVSPCVGCPKVWVNPRISWEGTIVKGANLSKQNFGCDSLRQVDFSGANLTDTHLYRADLSEAKFIGTDLTRTNLSDDRAEFYIGGNINNCPDDSHTTMIVNADLTGANLSGARLARVEIKGSTLVNANLSHADLQDANANYCNFTGADLSYANLSGANVFGAIFRNANMTGVYSDKWTICPNGSYGPCKW